MPTVSLIDVATYLPENRVPAEYYANYAGTDDLRDNLMFRAPEFRHHADKDWTNVDMVEQAAAALVKRHGADVLADVDVLLTHSQLPDLPILGSGGEVAHRLGMDPEWIIDVHNGGCAERNGRIRSYPEAGRAKRRSIANCGPEFRRYSQ